MSATATISPLVAPRPMKNCASVTISTGAAASAARTKT
jgi:hypothetical protein